MIKKIKKKIKILIKIKQVFFFEDYLETNKKNKISKKNNSTQDRVYLLFFYFSL